MKKIILSLLVIASTCATINAQKTVTSKEFSDTQARMLEVTARSYVKPLLVDVNVVGERTVFNKTYSKSAVEIAMGGNLDNLRSRAIYDATDKYNCDAIVAATFKIELASDGNSYNVEMKGFPANFVPGSWHPMDEKDYEWLKIASSLTSLDKLNNPSNVGAVIKDIRE